MTTRAQVIKLTVFLLFAVALALAVFVLFSPSSLWQKRNRYYVQVDGTAFGVQAGSVVLVRGVSAGTITRIEATTRNFAGALLVVDINPAVRVERSDQAYLQIKGFLGEKQLDIYGGVADGAPLKPGSYVPLGKTLLDQLSDRALALATEANHVIVTTDHLLTNLASLTSVVNDETIRKITNQLLNALSGFDAAGEQLHAMLTENRHPLHRAATGADRALEEAQRAMQQFRVAAEHVGGLMERMNGAAGALEDVVRNNGNELQETLRHLNQASVNIDALSRELREQPSRIIFSQAPAERELP
jgi:phospholipid/cholesterol/gamma-HCH transport system substrate-binding protein